MQTEGAGSARCACVMCAGTLASMRLVVARGGQCAGIAWELHPPVGSCMRVAGVGMRWRYTVRVHVVGQGQGLGRTLLMTSSGWTEHRQLLRLGVYVADQMSLSACVAA